MPCFDSPCGNKRGKIEKFQIEAMDVAFLDEIMKHLELKINCQLNFTNCSHVILKPNYII